MYIYTQYCTNTDTRVHRLHTVEQFNYGYSSTILLRLLTNQRVIGCGRRIVLIILHISYNSMFQDISISYDWASIWMAI